VKRELLSLMLKKKGVGSAPPVAIPRRPDAGPCRLSFGQERIWFFEQLEPGTDVYHVSAAMRLTGPLNLGAMRASVGEILRRHESLRTVFEAVEGVPVQFAVGVNELPIAEIDLRDSPPEAREAEALRLADEEVRRPFDLARGPLLRCAIYRLAEEEHVAVLVMHHIASDGWSLRVLIEDLGALYDAFAAGRPSPLAEPPIQYADFAHWQREWLQGEVLETQLAYWERQLEGAPATSSIPPDFPVLPARTFRGARQSMVLPAGLGERLGELSRQEGVTLFMLLLAAFATLLHRYTGEEDIVVGTPIANRNRVETENLIGFFVNTLVMRADLAGDPSFRELLRRVREVALGAYAHQDLPFERLVLHLRPERDLSLAPLFRVLFALQNAPAGKLELSALSLTPLETGRAVAKFDLFMAMSEDERGLGAAVEYNTDLYEAQTIGRLLEHFRALLESIASDPARPLSSLALLTEAERRALVGQGAPAATAYEREVPVQRLFERQAERVPQNVAVEFGGRRLSYAELNERANRLAHHLRGLGVGPEVLVGVFAERSIEMLTATLAVLKAGGAYVPLDPSYPAERLAFMLEDSRVGVFLAGRDLRDSLPAHPARVVLLDEGSEEVMRESAENPPCVVGADHLAYVIYTSGSTGKPKGVQVSHGALVNFLNSMRAEPGMDGRDALLAVTTLSFDIAGLELYLPLTVGARVVLADGETAADGERLLRLAERGITVMQATPTTWRLMLEAGWPEGLRLKALCGGEALPRELAARLVGRSTSLWNMYGPTETTIWSTVYKIEGADAAVLIGRPIANTQVYILDRGLNPVPPGVAGELYIGGDGVARGYLRRPDLTAERFVPDPFGGVPGARLYRTGDLARYRDGGDIECLGRIDQQVKVRGHRIEPGEVETVLARHPSVREAVVIARGEPQADKRLVAYVVRDTTGRGESEPFAHADDQAERLAQWEAVWDEIYKAGPAAPGDPSFNTQGWNSRYAGEPIPEEQMREWLDHTVGRILSLRPKRVWEIGCGTGLVLFRVAPHCEKYDAADFSREAVGYVEGQLASSGLKAPQVALSRRTADDFSGAEPGGYDTVIINSVAQYFPHVEYLVQVLEGALGVVRPGGHIFVGDVRHLGLQEVFYAALELERAPDSLPLADVRRRAQQSLRREEELCVEPSFFEAFRQRSPRITHVEVQVKRGCHNNEMTCYRYDVTLHVGGGDGDGDGAEAERTDWREQGLSVTSLRRLLDEKAPELLTVTNIPSARLAAPFRALELLKGGGARTASEARAALKAQAAEAAGVEPEELWGLGDELPYAVEVNWSASAAGGFYDATFRRREPRRTGEARARASLAPPPAAALPQPSPGTTPPKPWSHYANNPLEAMSARRLVPELRNYLKGLLPDYMVPTAFVLLDKMPLTPNGKVDRRALPAPEQDRPETEKPFVAPRTPVEKLLAGVWAEVLGLKQVGVNDNFFELGGDSILTIQVIARANRAGLRHVPRQLFQYQTISELASVIETSPDGEAAPGGGADPAPLTPPGPEELAQAVEQIEIEGRAAPTTSEDVEDAYPLSPAQEGMLFHSIYAGGSGVYVLQMSCTLRGLDMAAFGRAWQAVAERHATLRTAFVWEGGPRPLQVVVRGVKLGWRELDRRGLSSREQEEAFEALLAEESGRGFKLTRAPLMRLSLMRVGDDAYRFVWSLHHLLLDGWSTSLILKDFFACYDAFKRGDEPRLKPSPPYREYIAWLRRQDMSEAESFWRERLKGFSAATPLVGQGARQGARAGGYEERRALLPRDATAALQSLARRNRLTLNTIVQGAWALLLSHHTGREDVVFGATSSGRPAELPGVDEMVGLFINVLPMRIESPPGDSLLDWLGRVQAEQFATRRYDYSPLVQVQRWSEVPRGEPLFESILSFENYPVDKGVEEYSRTLDISEARSYSTTHYPMTVIVTPRDELSLRFVYDGRLLDAARVARMSEQFGALLRDFARRPDAALKSFLDALAAADEARRAAELEKREETKRGKFMKLKPKVVSLQRELVRTGHLDEERRLPLVVEPAVAGVDVADWAKNNRELIGRELSAHGALLLRGFDVESARKFEQVAASICPELYGEYGDLPREDVGGKIYGSTPYPANQTILFHNESSHMHRWPSRIFFYCVQAARQGGETPIVDCRRIYRLLRPELRERFEAKKLMYVRNYIEGLDVSWQDFFRTSDKRALEEFCRKAGVEFEWGGGNSLRTRKVRPAVLAHPLTGEMSFFNQLQLHHVSCLEPSVRETLLAMYREEELPRNVYYGDGSPLEDSVVDEIRELYWQAAVAFPWREGDILLLDNMLTAHARNPFVGPRRIVVAMGEMIAEDGA
jgi:amino acid adenylation domain-containing protein